MWLASALKRARAAAGSWLKPLAWRWARGRDSGPRVNYASAAADKVGGPSTKFRSLTRRFPHVGKGFNILYSFNADNTPAGLCRMAKRAGIPIVYNANGVRIKAGLVEDWQEENERRRGVFEMADYVLFQSEFSRECHRRFIAEAPCPSEVLYNAVDCRQFSPAAARPERPLTLLTTAKFRDLHRLLPLLDACAILKHEMRDIRFIVAGPFLRMRDEACIRYSCRRLGIDGQVEIRGPYIREDAEAVFRSADVYVHAKQVDACPNAVIEAMACGLPVVCTSSGGTPELVGDGEGGICVPCEMNYDVLQFPEPELIAEAVLKVAADLDGFAKRARERAVRLFDIEKWYARHEEVFTELLEGRS